MANDLQPTLHVLNPATSRPSLSSLRGRSTLPVAASAIPDHFGRPNCRSGSKVESSREANYCVHWSVALVELSVELARACGKRINHGNPPDQTTIPERTKFGHTVAA